MLKFVNISAYFACYARVFLLFKALKPLLLNVRALIISNTVLMLFNLRSAMDGLEIKPYRNVKNYLWLTI